MAKIKGNRWVIQAHSERDYKTKNTITLSLILLVLPTSS